jgi:hypothetical protein
MKPNQGLLMKLGSIIVHLEEYIETDIHTDLKAAEALLADPEVVTWIKEMHGKGLLPQKRSQRG